MYVIDTYAVKPITNNSFAMVVILLLAIFQKHFLLEIYDMFLGHVDIRLILLNS